MARSLLGVKDSNLNAYLSHMRTAVVYTTAQTTGTVMRTTAHGRARPLPSTSSRPQALPPTIEATIVLDADYLAAHPYTP